jgi:hypothetical protein
MLDLRERRRREVDQAIFREQARLARRVRRIGEDVHHDLRTGEHLGVAAGGRPRREPAVGGRLEVEREPDDVRRAEDDEAHRRLLVLVVAPGRVHREILLHGTEQRAEDPSARGRDHRRLAAGEVERHLVGDGARGAHEDGDVGAAGDADLERLARAPALRGHGARRRDLDREVGPLRPLGVAAEEAREEDPRRLAARDEDTRAERRRERAEEEAQARSTRIQRAGEIDPRRPTLGVGDEPLRDLGVGRPARVGADLRRGDEELTELGVRPLDEHGAARAVGPRAQRPDERAHGEPCGQDAEAGEVEPADAARDVQAPVHEEREQEDRRGRAEDRREPVRPDEARHARAQALEDAIEVRGFRHRPQDYLWKIGRKR